MKNIFISAVIIMAFQTNAMASLEINKDLKNVAIKEFLSQANDKNSEIGKVITQINIDTADGRNTEGTIILPVVADALQIVLLSGEKLLNPWKYAEKNEAGTICAGYSETASFLIMLSSKSGVHGASEFSAIPFQVNTQANIKAQYKNGRQIESCNDFSDEAQTATIKFSAVEYKTVGMNQVQITIPEISNEN
jgi:hypothetical protein